MARKARDLDQKLLEVGRRLLIKKGFNDFSMREVAKKAKVNLGMFSYYFKGKNDFLNAILNQVYSPFIQQIEPRNGEKNNLEKVLFNMAKFSRDYADIISIIIPEVITKDSFVVKYLSKHFTRHFDILKKALEIHFEEKDLDSEQFDHAMRFLIASIGIPNLMNEIRSRNLKVEVSRDSDEQLHKRVKAVIGAVNVIAKKE